MATGYWQAIDYAGDLAPTLDKPTEFIKWAEDIAALICHIYGRDYDEVTAALCDAAKEAQGAEDDEEDR